VCVLRVNEIGLIWGTDDGHQLRRFSGKILKLEEDSLHCFTFSMVNIMIHLSMSEK
jgi:hypothetical protein